MTYTATFHHLKLTHVISTEGAAFAAEVERLLYFVFALNYDYK